MTINVGDKVLLFPDGRGGYTAYEISAPAVGEKCILLPDGKGGYIAVGVSAPEAGDKVPVVPDGKGGYLTWAAGASTLKYYFADIWRDTDGDWHTDVICEATDSITSDFYAAGSSYSTCIANDEVWILFCPKAGSPTLAHRSLTGSGWNTENIDLGTSNDISWCGSIYMDGTTLKIAYATNAGLKYTERSSDGSYSDIETVTGSSKARIILITDSNNIGYIHYIDSTSGGFYYQSGESWGNNSYISGGTVYTHDAICQGDKNYIALNIRDYPYVSNGHYFQYSTAGASYTSEKLAAPRYCWNAGIIYDGSIYHLYMGISDDLYTNHRIRHYYGTSGSWDYEDIITNYNTTLVPNGTYRVHYTNSKVYMFLHTTLSSSTAYICNSDDYETQEAVSCDYTSFNGYPTFSVSDGGEIHIGTIVKK